MERGDKPPFFIFSVDMSHDFIFQASLKFRVLKHFNMSHLLDSIQLSTSEMANRSLFNCLCSSI